MGRSARLRITATLLALSVPVPIAVAGCSAPRAAATVTTAEVAPGGQLAGSLSLALVPAASAGQALASSEIGTGASGLTVVSVSLTSAAGTRVPGVMRADGSSWVPAAPLRYGEAYTARVVAADSDGRTTEQELSFRTMPEPQARPISARVNLTSGSTYGVAMPVVVDFGTAIPRSDRAAVERRLFVTSSPLQVGAWHWFGDREVMYRPISYWRAGTRLFIRLALGGVPIGGRLFDRDRTASATIGRDFEITVTDANHMLTVTSDDKVVKRYPISMGKPSTPSWSGHFVIIERDYYTVFDTLGQPGGYRIPVNYAERLTWSGTFIHSAPWSVYAQGHYNVSHGCVNVGPANAAWIFRNSKVGDPVSIAGTPIHAHPGNGWTVWDMAFASYLKGSALPAPQIIVPRTTAPSV